MKVEHCDGIHMDHLFGSYEFETVITKSNDGYYVAEACGINARHSDKEQALNDLNLKLNEAIEAGTLVPDMGN